MGKTQFDRRTFVKGAGVLGVALTAPSLVSACSGSSPGSDQRLVFWWNPSVESSEQMITWMKGVIEDFTVANEDTSVESVTQPSEQLVSSFRTACQSKSGPDLQFQYTGPYTMQFVWEQCVAPLDGRLDPEELQHVLPPEALDIYKFQDKTWALPWYNAPIPLMYNKALFKKAGLDPENPPATMEEFMNASEALRSAGVTPWGYGVKNLTGIGNFSGMFCTQNMDETRELLPVVLGEQKYTEPTFSEWFTWVQDMIDAEVFNDDVTSLQYQDAMNMFLAGKCAFAITSSLTKFYEGLGEDLGVMAPPKVGTGALAGRVHFNSHPLFITSFSEKKDLAARFLAYLHRKEALTGMYEASGFFPADDRFDSSKMKMPQDKILWDLMRNQSKIGYQNFWPSKMDRENVFLAVQSLFAGTRTPKQAAENIEGRLESWRQSSPNDLKNFREWSKA